MQSITVFCGASEGYNEVYREVAYSIGSMLAAKGIAIVYGAARTGIMGAVAEGALQNGGKVTGVIPHFLVHKELVHNGLTELITVDTMHERKMHMHRLSEGIIALPGGWGTMEELFEVLTWSQLGLHKYPIGVLNVNGYYDALRVLCNNMVQEGFLDECVASSLIFTEDPEELLQLMEQYTPPPVPTWLTERTA